MSRTSNQKVIHIHSNVYTNGAPKQPAAADLNLGELAINNNDTEPCLFIKTNGGNIEEFIGKTTINSSLLLKENISNKVIAFTSGCTDEQYPSAKLVYDTITDNERVVAAAINDLNTNKVDKVAGKGLSTNDFTNEAKIAVSANTEARHTHSNKELLDTYTQTDVDLSDAVTKKHEHSNKGLLDTYAQTEENLADAVTKKHEHSNKTLLDTYTQTDVDLSDAVTKKHEHSNKATLDTYDQTNEDLSDAVVKKHEHSNKSELDLIETGDKAKWDAKEDASNKITAFTSGCTDEQYPSAKLVYNTITDNERIFAAAINDLNERKSDTGHTHNYAASQTAGGSALSSETMNYYTSTYNKDRAVWFSYYNDNGKLTLDTTGFTYNPQTKRMKVNDISASTITLTTSISSPSVVATTFTEGGTTLSDKYSPKSHTHSIDDIPASTALTSGSTDSTVPTSKAVYDIIVEDEEIMSSALNDLNLNKVPTTRRVAGNELSYDISAQTLLNSLLSSTITSNGVTLTLQQWIDRINGVTIDE